MKIHKPSDFIYHWYYLLIHSLISNKTHCHLYHIQYNNHSFFIICFYPFSTPNFYHKIVLYILVYMLDNVQLFLFLLWKPTQTSLQIVYFLLFLRHLHNRNILNLSPFYICKGVIFSLSSKYRISPKFETSL